MKPLDLDHSIEYASHRDHSAEQCKNGDRLILMLVAELREYRQAVEESAAYTVVHAQQLANQILDEAKDTAKAMVRDAETRARGIVEAATDRAFEITRGAS